MNEFPIKRPSNFMMSRYILNECDLFEKDIVHAWIASSQEARKEFELFKKTLAQSEILLPETKKLFIRHEYASKCGLHILQLLRSFCTRRVAYITAVVVACALIGSTSVIIVQRAHTALPYVNNDVRNHEAVMTFRDTLEVLSNMTKDIISRNDMITQVVESEEKSDQFVRRGQRQNIGLCRADQTAMCPE